MKKQDPDPVRAEQYKAWKAKYPEYKRVDQPLRSKKNIEKRVARAERCKKALELRKAGASYSQIASEMGWAGESGAWKAVAAALEDIIREPAKDVLVLELARLDVLLLGVWTKAKNGDAQMIDRALRIMERRANYLGIDAPKKTATDIDGSITVTEGAHEELLARIACLTAAATKGESDPEPEPD